MPMFARNLTIQVTSEVATNMARYSALEDDLETVPYFFDYQLTRELPRRRKYRVIDFLVSKQAAQFESKKAWRVIDTTALRRIP